MSINFDVDPAPDAFSRVVRTRRTIHEFQADSPPMDAVLQAIELARWAPNHRLTEPWRFHLLGQATVQSVLELNCRLMTAEKGLEAARNKQARWARIPGWMVVTSQTSLDAVCDQENYAAVCCAIQNLTLSLWSCGIGTKWSTGGLLRHPEFPGLLQIDPARERVVGMIWYGYPASIPEMKRRSVAGITIAHP